MRWYVAASALQEFLSPYLKALKGGASVASDSVKWTAADRHGIFMRVAAAATWLKRWHSRLCIRY